MNVEEFLTRWNQGPEMIADLARLSSWLVSEARATVLAEEDRRVWCEKYATERNGGWSDDIATKWADGKLGLYREARAAWDARGEG